ncbi:hypothetical protein FB45DRAFT_793104 [Roridomyces roridus]|uniref:Uncharacterized protein n=1 Tax=Roridomyces roridus TaxID=1738132 RepID=A0AAD7FNI3_9AGAR|nr:hypothetical protein FB45DRAFT_793104 [Roridomyces roridus]
MLSPSLVGGIVLREYDLPGAIVFAAVYGLLVPALVYRYVDGRSRVTIVIQTLCYALERVVLFSLRAAIAAGRIKEAPGLSEYQQATFALGYLHLANVATKLTRCILVNSTKGPEDAPQSSCEQPPLIWSSSGSLWKAPAAAPDLPAVDDPQSRHWFRRWSECMTILYLAALFTAIFATALLFTSNASSTNRWIQCLQYFSAATGLVLVLSITIMLGWARRNVQRIDQRATRFVLIATVLLMLPPIYRLIVMRTTTADISDRNAESQNVLADKVTFYIVHILPEWLVVAMTCVFNVRQLCQTGIKGDTRRHDETPTERAKRERREQERSTKKAKASFEMKTAS